MFKYSLNHQLHTPLMSTTNYLIPAFFTILFFFQCNLTANVNKYEKTGDSENRLTRTLIKDIGSAFIPMDTELGEISKLYDNFAKFVDLKDKNSIESSKKELLKEIKTRQNIIKNIKVSPFYENNKNELAGTGVPIEDIKTFYLTSLPSFWEECSNCYNQFKIKIEMNRSGWFGKIKPFTELEKNSVFIEAHALFYGYLELATYIPQWSEKESKILIPHLINFPKADFLTRNEAELQLQRKTEEYENIPLKMAAIIGEESKNVELVKKELNNLQLKLEIIKKQNEEMDVLKQRLELGREKLRQKCTLVKEDKDYVMWNKIQLLANAGLYDDVQNSLDEYLSFNKLSDPNADTYVQSAKLFYNTLSGDSSNQGVLVLSFENNKLHSVLKIGDIILFYKGQRVKSSDDWTNTGKFNTSKIAVFLHFDNGKWNRNEREFSKDDPRILAATIGVKPKGNK